MLPDIELLIEYMYSATLFKPRRSEWAPGAKEITLLRILTHATAEELSAAVLHWRKLYGD